MFGAKVLWMRVAVENLGGGTMSQRRGDEGATLVTVDQPFRHRTNQNKHPESGCWILLVHISWVWRDNAQVAVQFVPRSMTIGRGCLMYCFILLVSVVPLYRW